MSMHLTLRRFAVSFLGVAIATTSLSFSPLVAQAATTANGDVRNYDGFDLTGSYSVVAGQPTGAGSFGNNDINNYPAGACVPMQMDVLNPSDHTRDVLVSPNFEYHNGAGDGVIGFELLTLSLTGNPRNVVDNLNDFGYPGTTIVGNPSFRMSPTGASSVTSTITGPFAGNDTGTTTIGATDTYRHYNIRLNNVPGDRTVYVLFCARMAINAGSFGQPQIDLDAANQSGQDHAVAINTNGILPPLLPSLTLSKIVSSGTATPDQWSFDVSPSINGQTHFTISSGQASTTIASVPSGSYTITESGPSGYTFVSGSGTNCSFSSATATAVIGSENASCAFTNAIVLPKLTVTKVVVNNQYGTSTAEGFPLFVSSTFVASGAENTFNPGTYTVTETNQPGYVASFSGDCDANGNVTLLAGEVKTCTITNDDIGSPSSSGGGGGGGGGGGSTPDNGAGGLPASGGGLPATGFASPGGQVLGIEDVNTAAGACWADEPDANIVVQSLDEILAAYGFTRDTSAEQHFDSVLVPRVVPSNLDAEFLSMIQNWTTYGTQGGVRLGAGERAGVVDSYRAVYGHVPRTACEWRDAIRIAMSRLPSLNTDREQQMLALFKTMYHRDADRSSAHDNAAINIMTYGIRPIVRSLANERAAIQVFKRIFGHIPGNATEWDTMRAMANSGLALP